MSRSGLTAGWRIAAGCLVTACADPVHEPDPPDVDSTTVETDDSDAVVEDTDRVPEPLPTLEWTELLTPLFSGGRCDELWHFAPGDGASKAVESHPFAGGWRLAGPDDPWYTPGCGGPQASRRTRPRGDAVRAFR